MMELQAILKGATPRPNLGESIGEFVKRFVTDPLMEGKGLKTRYQLANKVYNYYNALNLKNADLRFLTQIERRIQEIINSYTPRIKKELDDTYSRVAEAIANGEAWEHLVTDDGIRKILSENFNETGGYINGKYSSRYNIPQDSAVVLGLVMNRGLNDRLDRIAAQTDGEDFTGVTKNKIQDIVTNSETPAEDIKNIKTRKRARAIAKTETGIAQAIGESYTMDKVASIHPVKKYWVGRIDDKIRDSHLAATRDYNEGSPIDMNRPFSVNGILMMHPRDYAAPPSETANCRCYLGYFIG